MRPFAYTLGTAAPFLDFALALDNAMFLSKAMFQNLFLTRLFFVSAGVRKDGDIFLLQKLHTFTSNSIVTIHTNCSPAVLLPKTCIVILFFDSPLTYKAIFIKINLKE